MIPSCPNCGYSDLYVNVHCSGSTRAWFSSDDGKHEETDNDPLKMVFSKTVRCGKCNKKRKDLYLDGAVVKYR